MRNYIEILLVARHSGVPAAFGVQCAVPVCRRMVLVYAESAVDCVSHFPVSTLRSRHS